VSSLKTKDETREIFDRSASRYPYTIADLKEPRFYRRCMKRMQIALGTMKTSEGYRVLDVGCGTAYFTFLLSKPYKQVVGIDFSKSMMKIAKRSLKGEEAVENIELVLADGKHLPFRNNTFNAVLCLDFLHHLSHVSPAINEMTRVAMLGGKIVAMEPNFLNPLYAIMSLVVNQESLEGFLRSSQGELSRLFQESNLGNIIVKELDLFPQLFLKLRPFPEWLSRFLDRLEELLGNQPTFLFLSSHFAITGKKAKSMA